MTISTGNQSSKMNKVKIPKLHNPIEKHFDKLSRYQYYVFALLFLSKMPIFWHILSLIYLSPPMDFYCNGTDSSKAKNTCPCENPSWDRSVFSETMDTKFGIACETSWLINFSHSMAYLGSLFGSLIFGFLSDRFGRLSMFLLSLLLISLFGCITTLMPTLASFTFIRTLQGLGVGGAIVTGYVLCVEYCGVRHREVVTALFHIPLNIGHITLAVISYFLRDMDDFLLAISIPLFFFVPMKWLLMESPKWLMDSDRIDEAAAVMEKVTRFNRHSSGQIKAEMEAYYASRAGSTRRNIKFWQIFRHKKLSANFGIMCVVYFICGAGYYGVSQYIGHMSGDIHINVAISGAMLIPGTIAAVFLLHILSRRLFLMITIFLSGLMMLIVLCIPSSMNWERVIVACLCNSCFFVSFIIVFLYGVELFPTSVRNSVLGFLTVMARAGQISAPLLNQLPPTASGAIFGVLALLGAVLCYPLPETKNTELPSSLEDSKTLPRNKVEFEESEPSVENLRS